MEDKPDTQPEAKAEKTFTNPRWRLPGDPELKYRESTTTFGEEEKAKEEMMKREKEKEEREKTREKTREKVKA